MSRSKRHRELGQTVLDQIERLQGYFRRRFESESAPAQNLYAERDYLDAYTAHTDLRVIQDPHSAIGGMWDEIGQLQFAYLKTSGLEPHHKMLDIGCGTLRGGRHFIGYLDAEGYTGIDLSPKAIEAARKLVVDEKLSDKAPALLVNTTRTLKFEEFADASFDFLLAQSVFTHLKPEHLEECFAHVGRILRPGGSFHFTYFKSTTGAFEEKTIKDFAYPFEYFQEPASRFGLRVEDRVPEYPHPRGQQMARLTADPA